MRKVTDTLHPGWGGQRPGAGRKPHSSEPMERRTVTLPPALIAHLEALGDGNLSAGIRLCAQDAAAPQPAGGCAGR